MIEKWLWIMAEFTENLCYGAECRWNVKQQMLVSETVLNFTKDVIIAFSVIG